MYERALERASDAGIACVRDVTLASLDAWMCARLEKVQPQTARVNCQAVLVMLSHLERTGRYDAQQLARLRRVKPESRRRELLSAEYLTHEQVEDLCVIAGRGSLTEWTVLVAVLTGLRGGELARLRWDDVDEEARVLRVRWSDGPRGRIKTGRERTVPVVEPLALHLREHPMARVTRVCGSGLVLSTRTIADGATLYNRLDKLREQPDAFRVSLNLLRHTRASWWIQAGVPLVKVAAWLGHSPEVCQMHYAGLVRGYDPDADLGSAAVARASTARAM